MQIKIHINQTSYTYPALRNLTPLRLPIAAFVSYSPHPTPPSTNCENSFHSPALLVPPICEHFFCLFIFLASQANFGWLVGWSFVCRILTVLRQVNAFNAVLAHFKSLGCCCFCFYYRCIGIFLYGSHCPSPVFIGSVIAPFLHATTYARTSAFVCVCGKGACRNVLCIPKVVTEQSSG